MRGRRTLIVLMLAVLFGGLAGWSALRLLSQTSAMAAELPRSSAAQVVVAARDLEIGHLLGAEDVKVVEWPSDALPEGYAQTMPDVVGRGVIAKVRRNEPLLDAKMADRSGHGGLPIAIPEGMRAVSVPVDEVVSVAGFVVQGTRVDLYVTITPQGGDPMTKLVLQNVTVLAAGQEYRQDPQGLPSSVSVLTVLVSPEDGEKLVHAQRIGRIQLALRGMLDVRSVQTPGARVAQLLASPRA
ncbi:MAG: Flp pilus assembly protein CpaB, partial [Longimicrobiales bacterium]